MEILVPYKPTRIFDLQRKNNEDYCTACGTYTNTKWRNENYNWWYCLKCSKKRNDFVNTIVGNVDVNCHEEEKELALILELIRKRTIQERIYYLLDKWFVENENTEEPYNDKFFIAECLQEKQEAMNTLFHHYNDIYEYGDETLFASNCQSPLLKINYYKEIIKMYYDDREKMEMLLDPTIKLKDKVYIKGKKS